MFCLQDDGEITSEIEHPRLEFEGEKNIETYFAERMSIGINRGYVILLL